MIALTLGIVLVGGLVVWVFDRQDFPDLGGALWYTLQTVTTVGYGDKVPTRGLGRVVGATVMVVAVALIAILTASITSTFVEAAQRRQPGRRRGAGAGVRRDAATGSRRGPRPTRRDRGDLRGAGLGLGCDDAAGCVRATILGRPRGAQAHAAPAENERLA